MKKRFVLAALMAALSIPQFALADDGNQPKAQPKVELKDAPETTDSAKARPLSDVRWEVDTMRVGKVVTVGPDGKSVVLEFRGTPPKEVLDKLPKDIREKMQKGPGSNAGGNGEALISGNVVIDNDGKRQELFLPDLRSPNAGKRFPFDIEVFLRKAGDKLPAEPKQALEAVAHAINADEQQALTLLVKAGQHETAAQVMKAREQEAFARAVKAQEAFAQAVKLWERETAAQAQAMKAQEQEAVAQALRVQEAFAQAVKARDHQNSGQAQDSAGINVKLDKILDRLERLDKDVQAIKAKNDK